MLQQNKSTNYSKPANEENYIPQKSWALIKLFREYAEATESLKIEIEEAIIKRFKLDSEGG